MKGIYKTELKVDDYILDRPGYKFLKIAQKTTKLVVCKSLSSSKLRCRVVRAASQVKIFFTAFYSGVCVATYSSMLENNLLDAVQLLNVQYTGYDK